MSLPITLDRDMVHVEINERSNAEVRQEEDTPRTVLDLIGSEMSG